MNNILEPLLYDKFVKKYGDRMGEIPEELRTELTTDDLIVEFLLSKRITKPEIFEELEDYYVESFIDLESKNILNTTIKHFIAQNIEQENTILINIDEENKVYTFATSEMYNSALQNRISRICALSKHTAEFVYTLEYMIQDRYATYHREEGKANVEETTRDFTPRRFINDLLKEAILKNASDIHIEVREKTLVVRLRIDGVMITIRNIQITPIQLSSLYVTLKIMSGLDISEQKRPQDGRIEGFTIPERPYEEYDLRVNTVARVSGEKAVLRLLRKSADKMTFSKLGFTEDETSELTEGLHNANGIIFLAGSTGSGKSTTLYTMIDYINDDKINIYTIEDPVERVEDTVNQIQINEKAGITYSSTLKALLRQDPDVIVVGETRDENTLQLAIEASLTGHLVLTTIHANNSIDTISRLYNMGVDKYLISTSTISFLSQRLVRKLCDHCKEKVQLDDLEREWVMERVKNTDIVERAINEGIYKEHQEGCEHCNSGYSGRTAIIEVCNVTEKLRAAIARGEDTGKLKKIASEEGFKTLEEAGMLRVLEGKTSINELIRTI